MVNTLIQFKITNRIERVLWIDGANSIAITIDINNNDWPRYTNISDIIFDIESEEAIVIKDDPWARVIKEEEINVKDKEKRDRAWEMISIIADNSQEPHIFMPQVRAESIKRVSEKYGISSKTVCKYLKRYWQRGKNTTALLPDYYSCGGKGKSKTAGEVKLGRPKKFRDVLGTGVNISEEDKRIFRIALTKYYYNNKQNHLTTTYELMRREFYSEDYKINNGIIVPILKPSSEVPSFNQLKYFFYKERDLRREISSRRSSKIYLQENRAILGSALEATAPGSVYMIDATVADVYLVSRYNHNMVIGRPVVYLVMDEFSSFIVGLYIGLEGPSWVGSMMALANSAMDKVSFCKKYQVDIFKEEWNSQYLPDSILADRGEMESNMVENMISSLHIKISNTASFRGDEKSLIERFFRTTNTYIKPFIPGVISEDFKTRGGKDYRLDGKLDIFQFTQIIIKIILYHNNHSWLKNYNREEMMINDDIELIPAKLWNWGIANRAGKLRSVPEDIVKLNLLPESLATITERGIKFHKMYFSSQEAMVRKDFERARNFGSWKVKVSYDPRDISNIYIRSEDGRSFEKCFLLEHQERYLNKTLEEIEYLLQYEKLQEQINRDSALQSKSDLISDIEEIVNNATKETNLAQINGESKKKKIENIRENRRSEKMVNRRDEVFVLGKEENEQGQVIPINKINEEESSTQDDIDILRKLQRERLNGKNK
jgi:hypothetical protein